MENETGSVSFPWKSVLAVDAFKRDFLTIDCICLGFETPEGWIEVHEGTNGWVEFLDAVESSLAGFPPREEWWPKVAFPPFETRHSRLWTKPEGSDSPEGAGVELFGRRGRTLSPERRRS